MTKKAIFFTAKKFALTPLLSKNTRLAVKMRSVAKPYPNKARGDFATPVLVLQILMAGVLSTGCSEAPHGQGDLSQVFQAGDEGSFKGTWAKYSVYTSQSSALGISAKSSIGRYSLVKMTSQGGGSFKADETLCDVKTKSSGGTSITFSERSIRAIEPNSYTYEVNSEKVAMNQGVELLGIKLQNKVTDPITDSASAVYDQDGDSFPGMSVEVSAKILFTTVEGKIYTAQRTLWSEQGQWEGAGRIKGTINWTVEQKVLGSSNRLFTTVTPTIKTLSEESPFYLVKIPEGGGCNEVLALQGKDFPSF